MARCFAIIWANRSRTMSCRAAWLHVAVAGVEKNTHNFKQSGGKSLATAIQPKSAHREDDQSKATEPQGPIWEAIAQIGAQIPDDEWEQVPEDSSINYKRHLYGAPAQSK